MDEILSTKTSGELSQFILRKFKSTPEIIKTLTRNTSMDIGMLNSPARSTTIYDQRQLIRNIIAHFGPDWFLKNADYFDLKQQGPFFDAILSGLTVHDVMVVISKYAHKIASTIYTEIFETENKLILSFDFVRHQIGAPGFNLSAAEEKQLKQDNRAYAEILALFLSPLGLKILGEKAVEAEYWVTHDEPPYLDLYLKHFKGQIKFGQKHNAFVVPLERLDFKSPSGDPQKHAKALMELSTESFHSVPLVSKHDKLVKKTEVFLVSYRQGRPSVDDVADALQTSRRSLTRKLNQAGTSFRELSENALRERSVALERSCKFTRTQIAEELGYKDVTSYSRAIRRWKNLGGRI